jgi:hypothetical protein
MNHGFGVPAPRPDNFEEMIAAYKSGDPVEIARQKAAYNQQLIAGGFSPLYEVLDVPDITRPARGNDDG